MGIEEAELIYDEVKRVHLQVIDRINFLDNKAATILGVVFVALGLVLKVGYDIISSIETLLPHKPVSYILSIALFLIFFFSILSLLKSLKLVLQAFECGRISLDPHPLRLVEDYPKEDKIKILSDVANSMARASITNREENVKKSLYVDESMRGIYQSSILLVLFTITLVVYIMVNKYG